MAVPIGAASEDHTSHRRRRPSTHPAADPAITAALRSIVETHHAWRTARTRKPKPVLADLLSQLTIGVRAV